MTVTRRRILAVAAVGLLPLVLGRLVLMLTPLELHQNINLVSQTIHVAQAVLTVVATVVLYVRQPTGRLWLLLLISAWANEAWVLGYVPNEVAWSLGYALSTVSYALLGHVLIAFPTGTLRERFDRWLVGVIYLSAVGLSLLNSLVWDAAYTCDPSAPGALVAWETFCPRNVFVVARNDELSTLLRTGTNLVTPLIALLAVAAVFRHYRAATPIGRRPLLPVLISVPVFGILVSLTGLSQLLGLEDEMLSLTDPVWWVAGFVIPLGILLGALRIQLARGGIADLVLRLGSRPDSQVVQRELRRALRDPGLSVLFWFPATRGYVDVDGAAASPPADDPRTAVTLVERDDLPLAAIVHDRALLDEPELLPGVAEALRLVVERDRFEATVRAQTSDARGLPTGHVTFLYADIEGSTGLLQRLGDRYADLLAEHRRILSSIVRRAGGREVDARADEYFAVFVDAPQAVQAALAIQRRIASQSWPDGAVVRDRIGLHAGTPELTDEGYVGLDVHRAARVGSVGHGGQIVVSTAAREAIGDDLPLDAELSAVGSVQLRGLIEPEMLYEVVVPDLERRLEPLRT